jgi:hypothetical protein
MRPSSSRAIRSLATCGIVIPVLDTLVTVSLGAFDPRYSHTRQYISELGETGRPCAAVFNAWCVAYGLLMGGFAVAAGRGIGSQPLQAALLAVAAAGVVGGFFPCDPGCAGQSPTAQVHVLTGYVGLAGTILTPFLAWKAMRRQDAWARLPSDDAGVRSPTGGHHRLARGVPLLGGSGAQGLPCGFDPAADLGHPVRLDDARRRPTLANCRRALTARQKGQRAPKTVPSPCTNRSEQKRRFRQQTGSFSQEMVPEAISTESGRPAGACPPPPRPRVSPRRRDRTQETIQSVLLTAQGAHRLGTWSNSASFPTRCWGALSVRHLGTLKSGFFGGMVK